MSLVPSTTLVLVAYSCLALLAGAAPPGVRWSLPLPANNALDECSDPFLLHDVESSTARTSVVFVADDAGWRAEGRSPTDGRSVWSTSLLGWEYAVALCNEETVTLTACGDEAIVTYFDEEGGSFIGAVLSAATGKVLPSTPELSSEDSGGDNIDYDVVCLDGGDAGRSKRASLLLNDGETVQHAVGDKVYWKLPLLKLGCDVDTDVVDFATAPHTVAIACSQWAVEDTSINITAVDDTTGALRWTHTVAGNGLKVSLLPPRTGGVFVTVGCKLTALDERSGATKWEVDMAQQGTGCSAAGGDKRAARITSAGTAAADRGALLVVTVAQPDGPVVVAALDSSLGTLRWISGRVDPGMQVAGARGSRILLSSSRAPKLLVLSTVDGSAIPASVPQPPPNCTKPWDVVTGSRTVLYLCKGDSPVSEDWSTDARSPFRICID